MVHFCCIRRPFSFSDHLLVVPQLITNRSLTVYTNYVNFDFTTIFELPSGKRGLMQLPEDSKLRKYFAWIAKVGMTCVETCCRSKHKIIFPQSMSQLQWSSVIMRSTGSMDQTRNTSGVKDITLYSPTRMRMACILGDRLIV